MSKTREVVVSVHKNVPECCRRSLLDFAKLDRYMGGGEPGDQIGCGCGNKLIYDWRGWRVREASNQDTNRDSG